MSFPPQKAMEVPLLEVLMEMGGSSEPSKVYPKVAERFPELTAQDLDERLPSLPRVTKWGNRVQWVRQRLVESCQFPPFLDTYYSK